MNYDRIYGGVANVDGGTGGVGVNATGGTITNDGVIHGGVGVQGGSGSIGVHMTGAR